MKNPNGFLKACKSKLKKLLKHIQKYPNDIRNIQKINDKIKKCEEGIYRK